MAMTVKEQLEKLKKSAASIRKAAESKIQVGISLVEVSLTGGGLAYLRGRFPTDDEDGNPTDELSVAGVPVSLAVGLLAHGMGLIGAAGKYSEHVHNIGTGAITEYATHQLYVMGKKAREESDKEQPATQGMPPRSFPSPQGGAPGFVPHGMAVNSPMFTY